MDDHIIELDSSEAKEFGFMSDKFEGYLWKCDKTIYISLIISVYPREGNCRRLFNRILELGYNVFVPCPSLAMSDLCTSLGFIESSDKETFGYYREAN